MATFGATRDGEPEAGSSGAPLAEAEPQGSSKGERIDRSWTASGIALMSGSPYYSEPFDMEGNTRLRVEAHLLDLPRQPTAPVSVRVQGTDDGKAEKKNWVVEGDEIA